MVTRLVLQAWQAIDIRNKNMDEIIKTIRRLLIIVFFSLTLAACSSQRPVLYPNDSLKRAGNAAADQDINDCMERAEQYVSTGASSGETMKDAAVSGGAGAAIGAAAGAAGGAVVGRAGRGAAVGAAGGGAAGVTRGLLQGLIRKRAPSPVYKSFVNRCLSEKGYEPIGWQ